MLAKRALQQHQQEKTRKYTISLLSISASEPATMIARIVSLLQRQRQSNTNITAHSGTPHSDSMNTHAPRPELQNRTSPMAQRVHGTHGRKAELTTGAIGYIAMDLWGVDMRKSGIAVACDKKREGFEESRPEHDLREGLSVGLRVSPASLWMDR